MRNCISDINFFDVSTQVWQTLGQYQAQRENRCTRIQPLHEKAKEPKARRNHVSGMLNNYMIVYGGIDDFQ